MTGDRASDRPSGTAVDGVIRRVPWWRRLATGQDLRLVPAALVVWLATLLGDRFSWWWTPCLGTAGVLAGVAVLIGAARSDRRRDLRIAACLLLCASVVTAGWTGYRLHEDEVNPLAALAARGAAAELRVEITEPPKPVSSPGFAGRQGGARSVLIHAEAEQRTSAGRTEPASGEVLLIAPTRGWAGLLRGQQVTARGVLGEPSIQDGSIAVLRVRGSPARATTAPVWERAADALRTGLKHAAAVLPDDQRALLPALVTGDGSAIRPDVLSDFRTAGMAYLLAVGGYHFMIVCGAVLWLLRRLSVGPRLRAVVTGLVLAVFLDVAGPKPSVLRAALMVAAGLLAMGTGRPRAAVPALAGSIIALLLWRPEFGGDIGFALSVFATTAMILLARPAAAMFERRGVPPGLAELFAIAVSAHLATAPLIAAAFGQFSLAAVGANLVAEPAFVPTMVLGALAMACSPVSGWLAGAVARLTWPTTWWLLAVAHRAATLPAAELPWPTGLWGGVSLAAVILVVLVLLRFRRFRVLVAAALVGALVVLIPVRALAPGWPPTGWAMVDCDVGQGDGEVLATGDPGRAIVIDSGPDPDAMDQCLHLLDVTRIPLVVISHLHADHVGGLAMVLRGRSVGAVGVGPSRVPAWAWVQVRAESAAAGVPIVQLNPGERLSWPGLSIDVIGPPPAESWPAGDDPSGTIVNNSSLVLKAITPAGRVLLTGDVELAAQADLLNSHADLTADVLKIPHHGSVYSSPWFLDAVHARVAVASVGAGNPYGHPSPLTLGRLSADGALVLRTDRDGDIAITPGANGPQIMRRGDPRPGPRSPRRRGAGLSVARVPEHATLPAALPRIRLELRGAGAGLSVARVPEHATLPAALPRIRLELRGAGAGLSVARVPEHATLPAALPRIRLELRGAGAGLSVARVPEHATLPPITTPGPAPRGPPGWTAARWPSGPPGPPARRASSDRLR